MIDKVYMNLEKNEAYIIFEEGRTVRLSCDSMPIYDFYEWFMSDTRLTLEEFKAAKENWDEDTQIIDLEELEDKAA